MLLLVAGITAGCLLVKGVARLVESRTCRERVGGFVVRNPLWGWSHRPGARGWAQGCLGAKTEWRAYTRINSHGLRGPETPYERAGGFRVLVLGDSFTAGLQVDEQATFVHLLEERLAAEAPPGTRVEVLNAGVSGWGTDNLGLVPAGWRAAPVQH